MDIGIVILSRFSSNRLPGKALMEINGKPILKYILERLEQVVPSNKIIIATSSEKSDDAIEVFSKNLGIACFRGSLDNVAERFFKAAEAQKWDYAVRINGDNIFLDTAVLKHMISIADVGQYDFISNVKERTFPKGMSVEIVRMSFYKSVLHKIINDKELREHVTLYLYGLSDTKHYYYMNTLLPESAGLQMALDTKEDFERTTKIINAFELPHYNYNLVEIFNTWKKL
jgi:spore coat polysaccharide biosynthesis protein SpsF